MACSWKSSSDLQDVFRRVRVSPTGLTIALRRSYRRIFERISAGPADYEFFAGTASSVTPCFLNSAESRQSTPSYVISHFRDTIRDSESPRRLRGQWVVQATPT